MWRQKKSYILDILGFFVTIKKSFLKWHKTEKSDKYMSQWYYNRLGSATVWQSFEFIWVCTSLWCLEILLWADVPVLFTQERSWTAACSEFQNWNLCALHWMKMLVVENIQYKGSDYPAHFFDHTVKKTLHLLRWNIRSLQSVFVASGNPNIYTQMFIFNIVTLLRLHKVCTTFF